MYAFDERFAFSRGVRGTYDVETIRALVPSAIKVEKTNEIDDRAGTDYVVHLRKGATLRVDAKARDRGASRYWRHGPEVALETWSVMPGGRYDMRPDQARAGWTLTEAKNVDLILFTFDPTDCDEVFMVGFPLLRLAFARFYGRWMGEFPPQVQNSGRWESQCVFVPIDRVFEAMTAVSRGKLVISEQAPPRMSLVEKVRTPRLPFMHEGTA